MTSPNDQPLSRRAARRAEQSEQGELVQADVFAQPTQSGFAVTHYSAGTPASVPSSAPTDMLYRTQVRPRVPHYDDRSASTIPDVIPAAPRETVAPVAPPPVSTQSGERVRRRDFRPPSAPAGSETGDRFGTFDTPLEYHTQLSVQPEAMVHVESPSLMPASPAIDPIALSAQPEAGYDVPPRAPSASPRPEYATPGDNLPVEQTLSRRELRELRAANDAQATGGTVGALTTTEELLAAYPAPRVEPSFPASPVSEVASLRQQPLAPSLVEPIHAEPVRDEPGRAEPQRTEVGSPATGSHWSVGIHDDEDPFENTFSREVGSTTSLNTNALVLPEMPTGSIAGPVAGTGEIIVTGRIEVSHLVSSTGTVPTLHDSPDIDDLFDINDREIAAPDSAPVSALKAISSHTASHTAIAGKPQRTNTVTTVLVAVTVVMAVVAIGLFVIAAMNGLF